MYRIYPPLFDLSHQVRGSVPAVEGGGHYAAGVARTFTGWVEAGKGGG